MNTKYLTLAVIGLISSVCFAFAATPAIQVSAIVGAINHAPVVLTVLPSSDPKLLARGKIQNYSVYFRDDEKNTMYYTVTPVSGFASPISGTISPTDYDSASGAYVNFTYLAPSTTPAPNPTTVTVTLNDGPNLVNKDLRVYIY